VVGEKVLVNEISVQVQIGEVLAVVGPSGSGKGVMAGMLVSAASPVYAGIF
jgi:ABC-type protease/lipase transport system fused ATPase/permease subunit